MFQPRKIYLASSWRNEFYPTVLAQLRHAGHEVYDFKEPACGIGGFGWSEIDPAWKSWTQRVYRAALYHPIADAGFKRDRDAMAWADTGVLLLPSGRSAHVEAGVLAGWGTPVHVLMLTPQEPELMYRLFKNVCVNVEELLALIGSGGPPQLDCPVIPRQPGMVA